MISCCECTDCQHLADASPSTTRTFTSGPARSDRWRDQPGLQYRARTRPAHPTLRTRKMSYRQKLTREGRQTLCPGHRQKPRTNERGWCAKRGERSRRRGDCRVEETHLVFSTNQSTMQCFEASLHTRGHPWIVPPIPSSGIVSTFPICLLADTGPPSFST
ncbi:hypothetical protein CALCODRAFT_60688 [Calocera cornea HHB12733]|uniref:Uncharacterized protein n=1 Tax=Calocera cornea HHB12733 TaxID=1353952 RepID=A0A165DNC3_9BASI|nr:hypothetical protein CALCODRAFT_60688 [Calocera cornea HHB12733]